MSDCEVSSCRSILMMTDGDVIGCVFHRKCDDKNAQHFVAYFLFLSVIGCRFVDY